jgi:hypothetical protein
MIGKKSGQVSEATDQEILESLDKLDKVIRTHPQKSQRAQAGSFKAVLLNEMSRRWGLP